MTDTQSRIARARRVVENYSEGWQRDHRDAIECYEFEADLAFGVVAYRAVEAVRELVKHLVFQGGDPALWDQLRGHYARWLEAANADFADLDKFEKKFGTVASAPELRDCIGKAQDILNNWTQIPSPKAVGSRVIPLSDEEATELDVLRKAPVDSPGKLKIQPRAVPLADDSLLT